MVSCGKYHADSFHEMGIHLCGYFLEVLLDNICACLAYLFLIESVLFTLENISVACLFSQVVSLIAISHSSASLPFGQGSHLA